MNHPLNSWLHQVRTVIPTPKYTPLTSKECGLIFKRVPKSWRTVSTASLMSSSDQASGNSVLEFLPAPNLCPPNFGLSGSPSRICRQSTSEIGEVVQLALKNLTAVDNTPSVSGCGKLFTFHSPKNQTRVCASHARRVDSRVPMSWVMDMCSASKSETIASRGLDMCRSMRTGDSSVTKGRGTIGRRHTVDATSSRPCQPQLRAMAA